MKRAWTEYWQVLVFLPVVVAFLLYYLRWEQAFRYAGLAPFSDDLFYYLQIARHVLQDGRSTFDGQTLTNGYHPLWMGAILAIGRLSGGIGDAFFAGFRVLLGTLCMVSCALLLRLCRWAFKNAALGYAAFVYFAHVTIRLTLGGMEVALTIPLLLALALSLLTRGHTTDARHVTLQTALGAAAVFSRLDAIVFVMPALATVVFTTDSVKRRIASCVLSVGVIGLLLAIYLAWNQRSFGSWMPVSGVAKALKTSLLPSQRAFSSLFALKPMNHVFMALLPFLAVLAGCLVWLIRGAVWQGRQRWMAAWILCFPPVYYVVLALRSDWPWWNWYYYPLPMAAVVAMGTISHGLTKSLKAGRSRWLSRLALLLAAGYVVVSSARVLKLTPLSNPCYSTALCVEAFSKDHPGVYAMGDQAGLVSFVTGLSVVQVEGLVTDTAMIQHLKAKDDLRHVLSRYRVDYYVTIQSLARQGSHLVAREPAQAGDLSSKMTGVFSAPPVLRKELPNGVIVNIFRVSETS